MPTSSACGSERRRRLREDLAAARRARSCSRSRRRGRTRSGEAAGARERSSQCDGRSGAILVAARRHDRPGVARPRASTAVRPSRAVALRKPDVLQAVAAGRRFSWRAVRRSIAGRERPGHRRSAPSRRRGVRRAAAAPLTRRLFEADGYRAPRLFPQSRRLSVGLPGPYARSRIHPIDRGRPLRRRLPRQLGIERLSREFSAAPATVPASPRAAAAASRRARDTARTMPSPSRSRSAG